METYKTEKWLNKPTSPSTGTERSSEIHFYRYLTAAGLLGYIR